MMEVSITFGDGLPAEPVLAERRDTYEEYDIKNFENDIMFQEVNYDAVQEDEYSDALTAATDALAEPIDYADFELQAVMTDAPTVSTDPPTTPKPTRRPTPRRTTRRTTPPATTTPVVQETAEK